MTPEELHNIFRSEEEFWWYRGMRAITDAFFASDLKDIPGRKGLDVGCGTGYNALLIQSQNDLQMTGVDVAPLALKYCRQRGLERAAVASAMELPFPHASFDVITSFD